MMAHRQGGYRRPALSLAEVVGSMAVMAVVMGGMGSALVLASRAVPSGSSVFHDTSESGSTLQQLVAELHTATAFAEWSPNAVEFTVHDRNGDTIPEIIRYAWSGAPGAPITYTYNRGTPRTFAPNVHAFSLGYRLEQRDEAMASNPQESEETLLMSYDATKDLSDADVKSDKAVGQYFLPTFPALTSSWSVTRIKFKAKPENEKDGTVLVQLSSPNAQYRPSGTVLEQHSVPESALDSDLWQEVTFSGVSGLSPQQGLCLTIVRGSGSDKVAKVRYRQQNVGTVSGSLLIYDADTWSSSSSARLLYYVYGRITSTAPTEIMPVYQIRDVQLTIQVGADTASRLQTTVQVLNSPEVSGLQQAIY